MKNSVQLHTYLMDADHSYLFLTAMKWDQLNTY